MIKWGGLRRTMLSWTGNNGPCMFIPRYEIAVYEGSPKVVLLCKEPTYKFFYLDKETASEKWDELVAILSKYGLLSTEIGEFIRDGNPRKQGVMTNFPSFQDLL